MKKGELTLRNEALNTLQKALLLRRERIVDMAKKGYSDFAIARYFRISPKGIRRELKNAVDIPGNRKSTREDIDALLVGREEILKKSQKPNLRAGFLGRDYILSTKSIYEEFYACYWTLKEIQAYFKEVEGEEISESMLRFNKMQDKKSWPQNEIFVKDLLECGYNACDIVEYLSVPEHVMDKIKEEYCRQFILKTEDVVPLKEEKKRAKKEWIKLKSKDRVEKVYYYRVVKKISEEKTGQLLGVSRGTVHNDLKRYFEEHPELKDEYCDNGRRRRYY